jgi:NDP-sugar pyrophosphorylase family protein
LGERVRRLPKPLLEVAGEPFVFHQLRLLASYGVRRVVLCVGYLGELIEHRVGMQCFGMDVDYSYDTPELDGTLGAIRRALPLLGSRFLVLYGDTYLRVDYAEASRAWCESGLPAMMTVLRNEGRWDESNASYAGGRVTAYDKQAPQPGMCWIDYGLGGLEQQALDLVHPTTSDLSDLYSKLAQGRLLFGFEARDRFYEIGTPQSLAETDAFLQGLTPTPRDAR